MAVYGEGLNIGQFSASVAFDAYTFGAINGGQICFPKAGDYVDGVVMSSADIGSCIPLRFEGTAKIILAEAVKENAFLATNGSGQAVVAKPTDFIVGRAMEQSESSGTDLSAYSTTDKVVLISQFKQMLIDACNDADVQKALKQATLSI